MQNDAKDIKENGQPWYVLYHLNPVWIENMLQKDSDGLLRKEDEIPLPPYRFFIPFQSLPHIASGPQPDKKSDYDRRYNPKKDENSLRNDLRCFVFIQAPAWRVDAIVRSDWNTNTRLHLSYYRNTDKSLVKIPDADMHRLIQTLQDRVLKFYLDQPVDDFSVGDKVILQMEPWTGKTAEIKKIEFKQDSVRLVVSMNLFGRSKSITFTDISIGDVFFKDKEKNRMLSGNPITNYEEEIIDLLSHRFKQKYNEEVEEQDKQRLRRLAAYSNIYVENLEEQARYLSLKLICAHLRKDKTRAMHYTEHVMSKFQTNALEYNPEDTFAEAYMKIALFIVTRDPRYRDAVKAYRSAHPDCPDILRRFHSIVKGLRPKKCNKKTH